MYTDVMMAGSGGQGILMIGDLLALAGLREGRHVSWMPAYGVEMRGGTANTTVVVSDDPIGSPITAHPYNAIVMNRPSLDKFAPTVRPGGVLIVNKAFIELSDIPRADLNVVLIPSADLALEIGDIRLASMTALGAFIQRTNIVKIKSLVNALAETLPAKRHSLIPLNEKAIQRGFDFAADAK